MSNISKTKKMIPLYEPYKINKSLPYVRRAIETTWISSKGEFLEKAKSKLESIIGNRFAQLLCNGTAAVHLMAKTLRKFRPGINSIIVPNNVYVAAWNPFLSENYKLIPIDANIKTWNVDIPTLYEEIGKQSTDNTALLVVHNLGNVVNVDNIQKLFPDLTVIEDNCEGFLGRYNGKLTGSSSLCGALSFFGNKTITCGEGGALITNDEEILRYVCKIQGQGQSDKTYLHDEIGFNYRMTNICSGILCSQLDLIKEIHDKKRKIFHYYRENLEGQDEISFQEEEESTQHSYWVFAVRIKNSPGYHCAKQFLLNKGIDSRPMFYPISDHDYLKEIKTKTEIAALLKKECFMLPSSPNLTEEDQDKVIRAVKDYAKKVNSK